MKHLKKSRFRSGFEAVFVMVTGTFIAVVILWLLVVVLWWLAGKVVL